MTKRLNATNVGCTNRSSSRFARTSYAQVVIAVGAALILGCCTQQEAVIESPETWQEHLKPANLQNDFVPLVIEKIYVPVYSHIYHEDKTSSTLLAGTLSIRNTDPSKNLILKSVSFYNTNGQLQQQLCPRPVVLGPMSTAEIVVPRRNTKGGSGANFIVEWMCDSEISEPIAEAIMVSCGTAQVSFVSRGAVVSRIFPASKLDKKTKE